MEIHNFRVPSHFDYYARHDTHNTFFIFYLIISWPCSVFILVSDHTIFLFSPSTIFTSIRLVLAEAGCVEIGWFGNAC